MKRTDEVVTPEGRRYRWFMASCGSLPLLGMAAGWVSAALNPSQVLAVAVFYGFLGGATAVSVLMVVTVTVRPLADALGVPWFGRSDERESRLFDRSGNAAFCGVEVALFIVGIGWHNDAALAIGCAGQAMLWILIFVGARRT